MNPDQIVEFEGKHYRKSDLTDQEFRRIAELDDVAMAASFGKKFASFLSRFGALMDLAMITQLSFRQKMEEDLEGREIDIHKH